MTHHGQPENPFGQPQLPPQPYGQRYAPQPAYEPPPPPPPHRPEQPRSQALATIALVGGVIALVAALWVVSRGVAPFIGAAALILSIVALVRRQGGTALAVIGLTAGMASIPLAIILFVVAQGQQARNDQSVQCMQDAIEQGKSADEMWACGK